MFYEYGPWAHGTQVIVGMRYVYTYLRKTVEKHRLTAWPDGETLNEPWVLVVTGTGMAEIQSTMMFGNNYVMQNYQPMNHVVHNCLWKLAQT